jgi:hypothetical protein
LSRRCEVVSAVEVAQILGVSRQRVHQLLADHPGFPHRSSPALLHVQRVAAAAGARRAARPRDDSVMLAVGTLASVLLATPGLPGWRFRLQLLSGEMVDCVLLGEPGGDVRDGDIIRLPDRRGSRGPLPARRVEVLARPDGPPVRVVEGRLPVGARVARLGVATCLALAATLVGQLWLLWR